MGSPKSKQVNHGGGQALVFYDESNESSWIDAYGASVRKWEMRYGTNFTTAKEYTVTVIGTTPTIAQGVTAGVRAVITNSASKWDELEAQLIGTPFQLTAGYPLYFGASLTFDSASLGDWFVGLCSTDTTIFAAGSDALDVDASCAGFYGSASTAIYAYNEIHANNKSTTATAVLDTNAHKYEFLYDGAGTINYFLDDVLVGAHTTYIPTVVMAPSIALKNSSAAARTGYVNWMRCIQLA
jgi:hypothetical protein